MVKLLRVILSQTKSPTSIHTHSTLVTMVNTNATKWQGHHIYMETMIGITSLKKTYIITNMPRNLFALPRITAITQDDRSLEINTPHTCVPFPSVSLFDSGCEHIDAAWPWMAESANLVLYRPLFWTPAFPITTRQLL